MAVCCSLFEDKLYTLCNLLLKAYCFQFMGCSVLVTAQLKTAKKLVGILYNGKYQVLEDS